MGGIIFNSTYFLHTHRTAYGKIIVHAHPFKKSAEKNNPEAQHKHNKVDLYQFNSIDDYVLSHSVVELTESLNFEIELLSKPCLNFSSNIYFLHTTRGPPVVIS